MSGRALSLQVGGASDGSHKYTLRLEIKKSESGDHINYKHDGGRFEAAQETVKIITGLAYLISVTPTPRLTILGCELSGEGDWQNEELQVWTPGRLRPTGQLRDSQDPTSPTPTTAADAAASTQPPAPHNIPLVDLLDHPEPAQQNVNEIEDIASPQAPFHGSDIGPGSEAAGFGKSEIQGQVTGTDQEGGGVGEDMAGGKSGSVCWEWLCRWPKSRHGQRTLTKLKISTKELGLVELPILIKVYREGSKHKRIGFALRFIQYLLVPDSVIDRQAKVVGTSFFSFGSAS